MSQKRLGKNILKEGSPVSAEEKRWQEFKRQREEELAEERRREERIQSEVMPSETQPRDSLSNRARPAEDEENRREED